jgi:micrococcal nuclease
MRSSFVSFFCCCSFLVQSIGWAELNPLLEKTLKYDAVKVERVLSVDTILISGDERIMLIGIDGPQLQRKPEVKRDEHGFIIPDDDPTIPLEEEVMAAVKEMLEGKVVRLEFDVVRRDDDNVLPGYVYLPDGRMANLEILRQGYADLKLRSPNLKYAEQFRSAYREARNAMRGLQGRW